MYDPEDCLMLSGLQHFRFCRRQWALIHIIQAELDIHEADLTAYGLNINLEKDFL